MIRDHFWLTDVQFARIAPHLPNDWKPGDKLWVVDVIASFGGQEEMLQDSKEKVFVD